MRLGAGEMSVENNLLRTEVLFRMPVCKSAGDSGTLCSALQSAVPSVTQAPVVCVTAVASRVQMNPPLTTPTFSPGHHDHPIGYLDCLKIVYADGGGWGRVCDGDIQSCV